MDYPHLFMFKYTYTNRSKHKEWNKHKETAKKLSYKNNIKEHKMVKKYSLYTQR